MKPLVIPVFIPHMGCPHQCVFCNQKVLTRKKQDLSDTALPDAAFIGRTIQEYLQYRGDRPVVELAFFGGNFLGLSRRQVMSLLEAAAPHIDNKSVNSIRFSTRPDTISDRTLGWISSYPVSVVELGVQSMTQAVLINSNRGHTVQDTIAAIDLLKQKGYRTGVQMMVGLPGETESSLLAGTHTIASMSPDIARIYPLLVLAHSPLARLYKQGKYSPLSLDEAVSQTAQMVSVFRNAGVRVIRTGLQASDLMADSKTVLDGPWHPSFGHLVFAHLMYESVARSITSCLAANTSGKMMGFVHPDSESRLRGDKNANMVRLAEAFPRIRFMIKKDNTLDLNQVRVENHPG